MKRLLVLCLALLACNRERPRASDTESDAAPPPDSGLSEYAAHVNLVSPLPGATITSPLRVMGSARGFWFFEASFPVMLLDGNGDTLDMKPAQAQGEWMNKEWVPFATVLEFTTPATTTGTLVLRKDNPSGLPENDAEVRIPVRFTP